MSTPQTFKTTATFNGNHYDHFGTETRPEILELTMKISDNQELPDKKNKSLLPDYWGWFCNEKQEFTIICHKRYLLGMQFPYKIQSAEDNDEGKAYRLEVIEAVEKGTN